MPGWVALVVTALRARDGVERPLDSGAASDGWFVRLITNLGGSFVGSFIVTGGVLMLAGGWTAFWRHIGHPHVDRGSFDLLIGAVVASMGMFFSLYFPCLVALAAFDSDGAVAQVGNTVGSRWTIGPFLYFMSTLDLFAAVAWGFPRPWLALPLLPIGGLPVLVCVAALTRSALSPLPSRDAQAVEETVVLLSEQ